MGQWEPLADRIPVDVRRLATQLRRMKDRSGLTVPALAARTAQPPDAWERAFAGRHLPPLDAVEVLAQVSGADYDRIGALWKLAEKAATGSGDRGRGRPLPQPDPLDPLSPEEGLPRRSRRLLLLATVGALAVAALVAVLLTAGPSTGRVPPGTAGPTAGGPAVPERGPSPSGSGTRTGGGSSAGTGTPSTAGPSAGTRGGDRPSPAMDSLSPTSRPSASPGSPRGTGAAPPSAPGTGGQSGGGTTTAPPATTAGGGSGGPSSPSGPTPSPSSSRVCLGLIVLGVCLG
ncbi:Helix-turn-helix domain-containing protein [Actinacidiphila rubida]|uniref:Helix-turn-helix domain-containing protein n=1 Tax=Actinacidiphila rubida TaxID=310780 RepID=A0A1H8MM07_9ACTN|nr:helix-turn-helix transcriptional regulator [Actinacidiphila rubida]SEO18415.1 Helix-turn-helix domain-containing protein [Actinacidiphila rubida]